MNAQQLSCQATTPHYKGGTQYIETTIPLVQAPARAICYYITRTVTYQVRARVSNETLLTFTKPRGERHKIPIRIANNLFMPFSPLQAWGLEVN